MPLFSNKRLSLPHCPKWYLFAFVLQGLLGTDSEALWKRQRRMQDQFYFHEMLYTKVMITNDPCLPPKLPLPPASRSWQPSAFVTAVPGHFSRASCHRPHCGFLCSTVIPMAVGNPSDLAQVKWVKLPGHEPACGGQRATLGNLRMKLSCRNLLRRGCVCFFFFFMELEQDWYPARGCSCANLVWVTHGVCCTSSPFGLWFLCVFGD